MDRLINENAVLSAIGEWIAHNEHTYTNATEYLRNRVKAIKTAEQEPCDDLYRLITDSNSLMLLENYTTGERTVIEKRLEPCEDCITLRLKKGTLKYSDKDYVVYKKEWLKKWWQPELALLGIELQSIQPTAKENLVVGDCISRQAVISMIYDNKSDFKNALAQGFFAGRIKNLSPVTPKPKTDVLDKIRAEIQSLRNCSCSCSDGIIDDIEDIIDKYKSESEDKE